MLANSDYVEFYMDGDVEPVVVLLDEWSREYPAPEERLRLLAVERRGLVVSNPALVAMEYIMRFQKSGVCRISILNSPAIARYVAVRVRCWMDGFEVSREKAA